MAFTRGVPAPLPSSPHPPPLSPSASIPAASPRFLPYLPLLASPLPPPPLPPLPPFWPGGVDTGLRELLGVRPLRPPARTACSVAHINGGGVGRLKTKTKTYIKTVHNQLVAIMASRRYGKNMQGDKTHSYMKQTYSCIHSNIQPARKI